MNRSLGTACARCCCLCSAYPQRTRLQITDDRGVTVTLAPGAAAHHQPAAIADRDRLRTRAGASAWSGWTAIPTSPPACRNCPRSAAGWTPTSRLMVALKPDVVLMATSSRAAERLQALGLEGGGAGAQEPCRRAARDAQAGPVAGGPDADRHAWRAIDAGVSAAAQSLPAGVRGTRSTSKSTRGRTRRASRPLSARRWRAWASKHRAGQLGPFPKLNPEYIVRANPDLIMVGQRSADGLQARPGWQSIRALREQRGLHLPDRRGQRAGAPRPAHGRSALQRLMARWLCACEATGGRPRACRPACGGSVLEAGCAEARWPWPCSASAWAAPGLRT